MGVHDGGVWHGDGEPPTPQDGEVLPGQVRLVGGEGLQVLEELTSHTAKSKHI